MTKFNTWEKQHQNLFNTIETIKTRKKLYREQNKKIGDLMGDFSTYLTAIDDQIESSIVGYLDKQVEIICGLSEIASYYLYECDKGGMVSHFDKEFKIKTIDDLKKCVFHFKNYPPSSTH